MRLAITREISSQIVRCELSYQDRQPIDVARARAQHRNYEACLAALGCTVQRLQEEPDLPDSVFVEDAAIVLPELAVITRPGAESRRPETHGIAEALRPYRPLAFIEAPGILDGGDVLRIDRNVFVGLSHRSNEAAVRQLRDLLNLYGYSVTGAHVKNCLHLKSAVTQVADDTLLINREWVDADMFGPMRFVEVDSREPSAANALRIGGSVIFPTAYPATQRRLETQGIQVHPVDVSELTKAEGGVTCCSLIFTLRKIRR
jgi:dimethylargininase